MHLHSILICYSTLEFRCLCTSVLQSQVKRTCFFLLCNRAYLWSEYLNSWQAICRPENRDFNINNIEKFLFFLIFFHCCYCTLYLRGIREMMRVSLGTFICFRSPSTGTVVLLKKNNEEKNSVQFETSFFSSCKKWGENSAKYSQNFGKIRQST